jgi:hypothetical protein
MSLESTQVSASFLRQEKAGRLNTARTHFTAERSITMYKFAGLLIVVALAAGCNRGTPGGSTSGGEHKPLLGEADGSFRITVPTLSTSLKQGESKVVTLGIKRGKNFDDDVQIKFDNIPTGVTIDPPTTEIKHGDTEAKVTVKASDKGDSKAAVGDFTVKVVGHPTKGGDATNDLKLSIAKK